MDGSQSARLKFTDGSRELIKDLDWDLSYDTPEEAERVDCCFRRNGLTRESQNNAWNRKLRGNY